MCLAQLPRIMAVSNLKLSNGKLNFQHDFYPDVISLTKMVCLNFFIS